MKPSLRTIAQALDVSVMTVNRALNSHPAVSSETRRRVLAEVKRQGYDYETRSRNIRIDRRKRVALFCCERKLYGDSLCNFFLRLHYLAQKRLRSMGYLPVPLDPSDAAGEMLRQLEKCGALLILGPLELPGGGEGNFFLKQIRQRFPELKILSVLGDETGEMTSVVPDDYEGGARAARQAYQKGHRHAAVFLAQEESSFRRRTAGFAGEFRLSGEDARCDVISYPRPVGNGPAAPIRQMLRTYLTANAGALPTLFFVPGGYDTTMLLDELSAQKFSVPEDFCVIGYDNLELLTLRTPEVTRIYFDLKSLIYNAVSILQAMPDARAFRETVILTPNRFCAGASLIRREEMRR